MILVATWILGWGYQCLKGEKWKIAIPLQDEPPQLPQTLLLLPHPAVRPPSASHLLLGTMSWLFMIGGCWEFLAIMEPPIFNKIIFPENEQKDLAAEHFISQDESQWSDHSVGITIGACAANHPFICHFFLNYFFSFYDPWMGLYSISLFSGSTSSGGQGPWFYLFILGIQGVVAAPHWDVNGTLIHSLFYRRKIYTLHANQNGVTTASLFFSWFARGDLRKHHHVAFHEMRITNLVPPPDIVFVFSATRCAEPVSFQVSRNKGSIVFSCIAGREPWSIVGPDVWRIVGRKPSYIVVIFVGFATTNALAGGRRFST